MKILNLYCVLFVVTCGVIVHGALLSLFVFLSIKCLWIPVGQIVQDIIGYVICAVFFGLFILFSVCSFINGCKNWIGVFRLLRRSSLRRKLLSGKYKGWEL